jgi:opacity protein-like surface antigen
MRLISLLAGAVCAVALHHPVHAADLGGYYPRGSAGGSIKDSGPAYVPEMRSANPCYVRADVGYGWSGTPKLRRSAWDTQDPADATDDVYLGNKFTLPKAGDGMVTDLGIGCGRGDRGFRGEIVMGLRGTRDISGTGVDHVALEGGVRSHTGMVNAYYDFGSFGGFIPYVGAGLGVSYNVLDDVRQNDGGRIDGGKNLSLAWSVMAGVGYKVSERMTLDFGYRYIDMGSVESGGVIHCPCGSDAVTNKLRVNDLTAHELKVGIRFHPGL